MCREEPSSSLEPIRVWSLCPFLFLPVFLPSLTLPPSSTVLHSALLTTSTLPASPSHLQHSSASDPSTIKNAFPEPTLSLAEFDKASLAQEVKAATAGSRKHDVPVELGGGQNKHGKEEDAAAVKLSTARCILPFFRTLSDADDAYT
jgi:hypothetical protein